MGNEKRGAGGVGGGGEGLCCEKRGHGTERYGQAEVGNHMGQSSNPGSAIDLLRVLGWLFKLSEPPSAHLYNRNSNGADLLPSLHLDL